MNVESIGRVINSGDFRMQSWLLESDLSAGAKLTFTVLASLAGGKDHAWPSQSYLADKVSVSIRTVQRYLRELVESGLIEKCRAFLKGRVRCFYKFLDAGSISSTAPRTVADQSDNMSPCSEIIADSPAGEASNCRVEGDNLSSSLNKVDTIKGSENLPPTPLQGQPSEPSAKSEVFDSENLESPVWTQAKKRLEVNLTVESFQTWIAPLIFEQNGSEAVIRCPNQFFQTWIKGHYFEAIQSYLRSLGISDCGLALYTPEYAAYLAEVQKKQEIESLALIPPPAPPEDLEALGLKEQFARIWDAYPVKKDRDGAWSVFKSLKNCGKIPEIAALIKSIKDHVNHDRWWREKMPPLLRNWLGGEKWRDKPYE